MDPKAFQEFDARVAAKAQQMWEEAGRPDGGAGHFLDRARALLEIAENPSAGRVSLADSLRPDIEPLLAVENQGEMPGLTDQGEDQLFPEEQQSVEVPVPRKG
jgi:hypothetical protein